MPASCAIALGVELKQRRNRPLMVLSQRPILIAAARASRAGDLVAWAAEQRRNFSRKSEIAEAIDHSLKRWSALTRLEKNGHGEARTL